jgi:hypothetical protein
MTGHDHAAISGRLRLSPSGMRPDYRQKENRRCGKEKMFCARCGCAPEPD